LKWVLCHDDRMKEPITLPRAAFLREARGRPVRVMRWSERDDQGPLFNFLAYAAGACAVLILVVDFEWQTRFLVGSVFLATIAIMALLDALAARAVHYVSVETTDGGAKLRHVTPTEAEAKSIMAALNDTALYDTALNDRPACAGICVGTAIAR